MSNQPSNQPSNTEQPTEQLTEQQAKAFYEAKAWEGMTLEQRARFQLLTDRLCMPFDVYQQAIEAILGRPVWVDELGLNRNGLIAEMFEGAPPPTSEEILEMIPREKLTVIIPTPCQGAAEK